MWDGVEIDFRAFGKTLKRGSLRPLGLSKANTARRYPSSFRSLASWLAPNPGGVLDEFPKFLEWALERFRTSRLQKKIIEK
jgi:hypothetical protein